MAGIIIILIVVSLIALWCIRTVNGFKKKEIRVEEGLPGSEDTFYKEEVNV